MKIRMLIFIFFVCNILGGPKAHAGYIGLSGNYNSFTNESMQQYKSKMLGQGFELSIGFANKGTSVEIFNKRSSMSGTVNLEGTTIDVGQKENTFGLKFSFFITPRIYLSMGYATHEITNSIDTDSAMLKAGVESVFNLDDGPYRSDGPLFGIGLMIYSGPIFGVACDYTRIEYTSREAINQAISLNLKFNVDLSFGSFR